MIVFRVKCGLGNQIFEFAHAYALSLSCNEKIYIDLRDFKNEPDHRSYALDRLNLPCVLKTAPKLVAFWCDLKQRVLNAWFGHVKRMEADAKELLLCKYGVHQLNYIYNEIPEKCRYKYLTGISQNYHYFDNSNAVITREIFDTVKLSPETERLFNRIESGNSVCVHIRRGDFVTNEAWNKLLFVCDNAYYEKAVNYIAGKTDNPVFYVFTNTVKDMEWIKENYSFSEKMEFVVPNTDCEDLKLMSVCKHFVLSNSSFSWWAQYLSGNSEKVVAAPAYWDTSGNRYDGIYMDNWAIYGEDF